MRALPGFRSGARRLRQARARHRGMLARPAARRLPQAPTGRAAAGRTPAAGPRRGHRLPARHRVARRLRAGALRDVTAHGEAVRGGPAAAARHLHGSAGGRGRFRRAPSSGVPVPRAPAGPGPEGRAVLAAMREGRPVRAGAARPAAGHRQGCASRVFARSLGEQGRTLPRPSLQRGAARPGGPVPQEVRRPIESVNDSLKGRLDLERCGGRGCAGVAARGASWRRPPCSGAASGPGRRSAAH
ncbi:hypothetical protein ACVW19_000848 [Streptomyces sp. TE5632]